MSEILDIKPLLTSNKDQSTFETDAWTYDQAGFTYDQLGLLYEETGGNVGKAPSVLDFQNIRPLLSKQDIKP